MVSDAYFLMYDHAAKIMRARSGSIVAIRGTACLNDM